MGAGRHQQTTADRLAVQVEARKGRPAPDRAELVVEPPHGAEEARLEQLAEQPHVLEEARAVADGHGPAALPRGLRDRLAVLGGARQRLLDQGGTPASRHSTARSRCASLGVASTAASISSSTSARRVAARAVPPAACASRSARSRTGSTIAITSVSGEATAAGRCPLSLIKPAPTRA